ncbi:MAG: RHS repeat-associated core domain-containing protein, partial [Nitrospirae bacterium]|nr:RHS repeat-associated core domain-containing protein [Nitrospirota bacterium]
ITQGETITTFVYDGDGGRVKKIVGSTTTRYISKLYECDNTNCTRFIWAGSIRIATIASNGTINYWHGDHLGSSSVITDATGNKVQTVTYYPYGGTNRNQSPGNPAIDVPYKYTGKELDSTGLYYYEARYYDPTLGRFISADTIVPNPRDPQSLNRYSYVENNPLRYTDPTGHFSIGKIFRSVTQSITKSVFARVAGWAICPMCMQYVDQATQRYAITGTAIMGSIAVPPVVSGWAGGGVFGGILGGAVGGAVGSASGGEISLEGIGKGALSGSLAGGIQGYYGNTWSAQRVLASTLAGGASSALRGKSFIEGAAISLATSGTAMAAAGMRVEMIASSMKNVDNASGVSVGYLGDGFKLGGGRWVEGLLSADQPLSPLGGMQGQEGSLLWFSYSPGSIADRAVEAYAGPHDWFNSGYWYNESGNAINPQGIHAVFGEVLNAANVLVVTPIVAGSVISNYAPYIPLR